MSFEHTTSGGRVVSRRTFLAGTAAGLVGGVAAGVAADRWLNRRGPVRHTAPEVSEGWGMPGPYPGRVIEVAHTEAIQAGQPRLPAIQAMIERGMRELTGADDAVEAWRSLFKPGEVVGIKVNPVGAGTASVRGVVSSPAVVREVIAGLESAGIKPREIVVYDRYRHDFVRAGYDKVLPDGVRWDCTTEKYDDQQLDIHGYDPDVYCEMDFAMPGADPRDDRSFRSHLALIVARTVDKIITIPVLKDHRSAGVTLALKNLSHGHVNNVCRSHGASQLNQCNMFIPTVVSMPPIRRKATLHILDGLRGVYEGGPGVWNPTFATWDYGALFLATDPVALDRIGWDIIDAYRASRGLAPVASCGLMGVDPSGTEQFDIRQPQHIALAATLGLGIFERRRIDHRMISLA